MSDFKFTGFFLGLVGFLLLIGVIIPALISDPSDTGVIAVIAILLGILYAVILNIKHWIEKIKKGEQK